MSNKPRRKRLARPPGAGGRSGGMDLNAMMAQVQDMQAQVAATQESLAGEKVEATAGGGMVKVEVSGAKEVLSIEIAPEVVDPHDIEMLQDLVVAAVNEGMRQAEALAQEKLGGVTGGLGGLGLGGPDLGALGLGGAPGPGAPGPVTPDPGAPVPGAPGPGGVTDGPGGPP